MIDLFIKPGDEIKINFVVATDKGGKIYIDLSKKDMIEMLEDNLSAIEEHFVIFKKPNFKNTVEISQSITTNGTDIKFNLLVDRYHKMLKLLKSWTLKDDKGEILEPNKNNIDNLNPIIADFLSNRLDSETTSILV